MFLDRHDMPGISAEDLAAAHAKDLDVQERYGVKYHTYWFDPDEGTVFCLAEGPSKEIVNAVHEEAHGALASVILELDPSMPLNSMLGAMPHQPTGTAYTAPALRAIVFTDIVGSVAQTHTLGDEGHLQLLNDHNAIVREHLKAHEGREVKHTGDGIMASFNSAAAAVAFGIAVQSRLAQRNADAEIPLDVSIGISAGEPVTGDNDDLFGAAVQLAARLCGHCDAGDVCVSVAVRELCIGKPFVFEDRGQAALKGVPEPTQVYAAVWRE